MDNCVVPCGNDELNFPVSAAVRAGVPDPISGEASRALAHQAGQILLGMGSLFLTPPFNEHIDRKTGDLLVSIGRKLSSRK